MNSMEFDLIAFLRARLDEDESEDWHRRACQTHQKMPDSAPLLFGPGAPLTCNCPVPERMMAEVEAKRRLIGFLTDLKHDVNGEDPWYTCPAATIEHDGGEAKGELAGQGCLCGRDDRVREGLTLLALPYAGRADYREEWRP